MAVGMVEMSTLDVVLFVATISIKNCGHPSWVKTAARHKRSGKCARLNSCICSERRTNSWARSKANNILLFAKRRDCWDLCYCWSEKKGQRT